MSGIEIDLTDSLGRYILAIYELISQDGVARSKDIASVVGVSRPSVTGALQKLARLELIQYQPYGDVSLTDSGRTSARRLLLKHRATYDFLHRVLGLSDDRAEEVAGEIEQHLPPDVLCRLVQFNQFYTENDAFRYEWSPTCRNLCEALYGVTGIRQCAEPVES